MTPRSTIGLPGVLSGNIAALTASGSVGCTNGCTSEAENAHETTGDGQATKVTVNAMALNEVTVNEGAPPDSLAALAAALVGLSAEDRAKLAAMLLHGDDRAGDQANGAAGQ